MVTNPVAKIFAEIQRARLEDFLAEVVEFHMTGKYSTLFFRLRCGCNGDLYMSEVRDGYIFRGPESNSCGHIAGVLSAEQVTTFLTNLREEELHSFSYDIAGL